MSTPRPHHYAFGHVALRKAFFHDPAKLVQALEADGERLIGEIWNEVGRMIQAENGDAAILPADGLELTLHAVGPRTMAAVIALPPPREMPEAHFVALVVERPRPGPSFHIGRMPEPSRYFTLELGMDILSRERRTVLCEWTREAHVDFGTSPEPTVAAFVKRVIEILDG